jgi:RNA polymerase sigma factor for flagellar operon FliA
MRAQSVAPSQNRRIVAGLPFVEALARRMAASMPNSIDIGDLMQDGVLGLIDAAHRFDENRGIKFETFAERRIRGAMIDALRRTPGRAACVVSGASSTRRAKRCDASWDTSRRWRISPPASGPTKSV